MDSTTIDIISKLKFIGKIKKGEKINVRYLYVQPNNWLTSIHRTFLGSDNRTNAYNFIEMVTNRAFEIITYLKANSTLVNKEMVKNLLVDLRNSTIGITNLKSTYVFDIMYCCKLDTLLESVCTRITDVLSDMDIDLEEETINQ